MLIEEYKNNVESKAEERRKSLISGETDFFVIALINSLFDEFKSILEEQDDERH